MLKITFLKRKNIWFWLFLIIVSFFLNQLQNNFYFKSNIRSPIPTAKPTPFSKNNNDEIFKVKKVIDGDTIILENDAKVRYIGINTPELHNPRKKIECFAKAAYEKNKQLVEGKMVKLEKDVSETDKYGRLLRYVFLLAEKNSTASSLFVNQYLVAEGYAYAATFPPDVKYAKEFLFAQKQAQEENKGLWKMCFKF